MLLALAMSGRLQVPMMAVAMTVLGFAGATGNVELDTHLILKVPDKKLARVSSIEMLLDFLAGVLGPALGGCLTECWGTEVAIWILLGVSGFIALASFALRNLVNRCIALAGCALRNLANGSIALTFALRNLATARQDAIPASPAASARKPDLTEPAPALLRRDSRKENGRAQPVAGPPSAQRHRAKVS
jgi:hypothetical protein